MMWANAERYVLNVWTISLISLFMDCQCSICCCISHVLDFRALTLVQLLQGLSMFGVPIGSVNACRHFQAFSLTGCLQVFLSMLLCCRLCFSLGP
jgi:hypothetical protein